MWCFGVAASSYKPSAAAKDIGNLDQKAKERIVTFSSQSRFEFFY
jgi:hypothetical protein